MLPRTYVYVLILTATTATAVLHVDLLDVDLPTAVPDGRI